MRINYELSVGNYEARLIIGCTRGLGAQGQGKARKGGDNLYSPRRGRHEIISGAKRGVTPHPRDVQNVGVRGHSNADYQWRTPQAKKNIVAGNAAPLGKLRTAVR